MILKRFPPVKGQRIIDATARKKGDAWLKKEQIIFKQTPLCIGTLKRHEL